MKDMEEIPCDAYTVGWVCVTDPEHLAVQVLLDQEFELPTVPNDDNLYLVGRMGKHNIVIAKSRSIGQSAAVFAATKMVNNFKNIRFVLMVGIGGGAINAPDDSSKSGLRDIMLGDVVVSSSSDNHGGVLQYDMGKQTHEGFEIRSHLNKPYGLLTDAVSKLWLKHKHKAGMKDMECSMRKAADAVSDFEFPGRGEDRLFKSDYRCETEGQGVCSKCSQKLLVSRETRNTDVPKIHHGLIGSANTVMKDAEKRDYMRQSQKILCFEMEAASLMDNLPCTVIRGISDYADSHKNDRWRYYAALTAAAYAKDLLDIIPPKRVDKAEAAWTVLREVHNGVQNLNQGMGVLNVKMDHNQRNIILNMLGNFDFAYDSEVTLESHVATETWLIEHDVFKTWIDGSKWDLRLYGEAGIGKTYLCALVGKYLKDRYSGSSQGSQLRPVIHVYLNDKMTQIQEQSRDNILKSLVKQLVLIDETSLPTTLTNMSLGNSLHESAIKNTFEQLLGRYRRTYLIIDGLSQCKEEVRNLLEDYPLSLIRKGFALSLLTTSHNYLKVHKEIDCDVPDCPNENLSIYFHFSCDCNGEDFDICQECKFKGFSCPKAEHDFYETYETVYIEVFPQKDKVKTFCLQKLEQASLKPRQSDDRQHGQQYHKSAFVRFIRENQGLVEPIAERIALHAQGNFQIAKFWFQDLMSKQKVPQSLDGLIDELDDLPRERLRHYFMERIENMKNYKLHDFHLALDIISMVMTAFRLINISALQHALALKRDDCICKHDLIDREAISRATNGLLRIARADDANSFVYLINVSMRVVRLDTDRYESFRNLHTKMARLCLQYLEHEDYSLHSTDLVGYPFLAYVIDHWADHVREASLEACFEKDIRYRVTKFLKDREKAREIGRKASERHPRDSVPFLWLSKASYGLHLCGWYNLSELVEEFHPDYSLLDLRGEKTPLQYACTNGSLETAKTLLHYLKWSPQTTPAEIRGAVQDAIVGCGLCEQERSAEHEIRRLKIVQMILEECGCTLDSGVFEEGITVLMYSVIYDYFAFATKLLQLYQIDVNIPDENGRTALWHTVGVDSGPSNDSHIHPCEDLVKLLLEKGASIDETIIDNARSAQNLSLVSILQHSPIRSKRKRSLHG